MTSLLKIFHNWYFRLNTSARMTRTSGDIGITRSIAMGENLDIDHSFTYGIGMSLLPYSDQNILSDNEEPTATVWKAVFLMAIPFMIYIYLTQCKCGFLHFQNN